MIPENHDTPPDMVAGALSHVKGVINIFLNIFFWASGDLDYAGRDVSNHSKL